MNFVVGHMTQQDTQEIINTLVILGLAVVVVVALVITAIVMLIKWFERRNMAKSDDSSSQPALDPESSNETWPSGGW